MQCLLIIPHHGIAAQLEDARAAYKSGVEILKIAKDPESEATALAKFQSAVDLGYPDAFGAIGYFHANGVGGVTRDDAVAFEWFRKGADLGSLSSKVNLAKFHLEGRGTTPDREKGLLLLEEAASGGSQDAEELLAEVYFLGLYHPEYKPDFAKALPHVQSCAQRGSDSALNMLGLIHKEGHGVPVDVDKAEVFFRQAALKGDFKAQSNLGEILNPLGEMKSRRVEAAAWLIIAAGQGEPLAVHKVNELQTQMNSGEWTEANSAAEDLRAKIQP
jgi:TPR repeat protein